MSKHVDFTVRGALRTQIPVTGRATSTEKGLVLTYTITEDLEVLAKRGLKDTVVPWEDVVVMEMRKKLWKPFMYLRTKGIDPLTSNPRLTESELWMRIEKGDEEAARLVMLGQTEHELKKGDETLDEEMKDVRDFLEGLNRIDDLDDLSDLPG